MSYLFKIDIFGIYYLYIISYYCCVTTHYSKSGLVDYLTRYTFSLYTTI